MKRANETDSSASVLKKAKYQDTTCLLIDKDYQKKNLQCTNKEHLTLFCRCCQYQRCVLKRGENENPAWMLCIIEKAKTDNGKYNCYQCTYCPNQLCKECNTCACIKTKRVCILCNATNCKECSKKKGSKVKVKTFRNKIYFCPDCVEICKLVTLEKEKKDSFKTRIN